MRFTKMHGLGNDYVYVNCFEEKVISPEKLAIVISDRHRGVGADGLILISPSDKADVRMRIFNADGSEAQMCGNGIRCVAKYAYEHNLVKNKKPSMSVETGRGVLRLVWRLTKETKFKMSASIWASPFSNRQKFLSLSKATA
jgi:diaminopimelate epimerase